jgi:hypothetical protein
MSIMPILKEVKDLNAIRYWSPLWFDPDLSGFRSELRNSTFYGTVFIRLTTNVFIFCISNGSPGNYSSLPVKMKKDNMGLISSVIQAGDHWSPLRVCYSSTPFRLARYIIFTCFDK